MIYFDNAATTFQKPPEVYKAIYTTMLHYGANAGRGGHMLTVKAGEIINNTRALLCDFFGIDNIERLAFFPNATHAINTGIKGVMGNGGHVVTTSMEHNSVIRPLAELKRQGIIDYTAVNANRNGELSLTELKRSIRSSTKLIVMTHASNVCGNLYDIKSISDLAHASGILFMVDASQTAGIVDIDASVTDILAFSGHKGLLGPQGTGGLYIKEGLNLKTLIEGGTGSMSESLYQPLIMPDRFESGTQNTPAIAALGEGIRFLIKEGKNAVFEHEKYLTNYFLNEIMNIDEIKIYGTKDRNDRIGVVSININNMDCNSVAQVLSSDYGIAVRGGLHCAPQAHKTLGTLQEGTVRFSFGYFNKKQEVDKAINAIYNLSKK